MPPTATAPAIEHGPPPGSVEELAARIAHAYRQQYRNPREDGGWYYIAGTYPAEGYVIVATDSPSGAAERYFRHDFTVDGESITFGAGTELEIAYVPVEAQEAAAAQRTARLANSRNLRESISLAEAKRDGRTLHLTVIAAGFNTSKTRFYTEEALRESGPEVFAGLKMYLNHQTSTEERARPEGDLRDWVASLTEVAYDPTTKRLRGVAKIVDPAFQEKIDRLDEQGLLDQLGVSIRAVGAGSADTIESTQTFRVDEFTVGRSVDFVTEPGAGGRAEFRESDIPVDLETVDVKTLRERRPDLVSVLLEESGAQEAGMTVTEEQLAAEKARADQAEQRAREAEEAKAAAESALEQARAEATYREAQEAIGKLIAESKLPKPSQEHLRESLKDCADVEQAKTAIESHRQLVEKLGGTGQVRDLGDNTGSESPAKPDLKSKFARFGMSEASAEAAAAGRVGR